MHCAGCENNIRMVLGGRAGVEEVEADARAGRVRVRFQPERIGMAELEDAVTAVGYRVRHARAAVDGS